MDATEKYEELKSSVMQREFIHSFGRAKPAFLREAYQCLNRDQCCSSNDSGQAIDGGVKHIYIYD